MEAALVAADTSHHPPVSAAAEPSLPSAGSAPGFGNDSVTYYLNEAMVPGAVINGRRSQLSSDPRVALQNAFQRGGMCLYLGAGFSMDATGGTDWDTLLAKLGTELQQSAPEKFPSNWDKLSRTMKAQVVEDSLGRARLLDAVRETCAIRGDWPTSLAKSLLSLHFKQIVTTNYDDAIELTLEALGVPYRVVTFDHEGADTFLTEDDTRNGRVLVIKMHGDLDSGNITLTDNDYRNFRRDHPFMARMVSNLLVDRPFVYYGTSMTDHNLIKAFELVRREAPPGAHVHRGFALYTESTAARVDLDAFPGITPVVFASRDEMCGALATDCRNAVRLGEIKPSVAMFDGQSAYVAGYLAIEEVSYACKLFQRLQSDKLATIQTSLGGELPTAVVLTGVFHSLASIYEHKLFPHLPQQISEIFADLSHHLRSYAFDTPGTPNLDLLQLSAHAMEYAWRCLPPTERAGLPERLGRRYMDLGLFREAFDRFVEGAKYADPNTDIGRRTLLRCVRRGLLAIEKMAEPLDALAKVPEALHTRRYHFERLEAAMIRAANFVPKSEDERTRLAGIEPAARQCCDKMASTSDLGAAPESLARFRNVAKLFEQFLERESS